ncbi:MAG: 4Fe-4S binding protein [Bacillota bacterium]
MEKQVLSVSDWVWIVLLGFLTLGWFYPPIGIIAIICMAAPVVYGFLKGGRVWCGSFCPRGSFLGRLIGRMSSRSRIPKLLASSYFRYGLLVFLLGNFGWGIYSAWGSPRLIGLVFLRLILITTLFAIALGIKYQPRTWCTVCPMGTLSTAAIKTRAYLKKPLKKPGRK